MVVRANPDGYTIGYANVVTLAIDSALLPSQPYDADRDLALKRYAELDAAEPTGAMPEQFSRVCEEGKDQVGRCRPKTRPDD